MAWSATELHIRACCYLVENDNRAAAMLLRSCILGYEEKNDTAFITITAPPDSYEMLEILGNSLYMDLVITPEKFDPEAIRVVLEDDLIIRSIYQAFARLVLDPIRGTPTTLQVSIKEASEPAELQPQNEVYPIVKTI